MSNVFCIVWCICFLQLLGEWYGHSQLFNTMFMDSSAYFVQREADDQYTIIFSGSTYDLHLCLQLGAVDV